MEALQVALVALAVVNLAQAAALIPVVAWARYELAKAGGKHALGLVRAPMSLESGYVQFLERENEKLREQVARPEERLGVKIVAPLEWQLTGQGMRQGVAPEIPATPALTDG